MTEQVLLKFETAAKMSRTIDRMATQATRKVRRIHLMGITIRFRHQGLTSWFVGKLGSQPSALVRKFSARARRI